MGLLLSVLIFSVGVIETIACFRHAQNTYITSQTHAQPLQYHKNSANTAQNKSKVDISWPEDISYTHVHGVKKRPSEAGVVEVDETEQFEGSIQEDSTDHLNLPVFKATCSRSEADKILTKTNQNGDCNSVVEKLAKTETKTTISYDNPTATVSSDEPSRIITKETRFTKEDTRAKLTEDMPGLVVDDSRAGGAGSAPELYQSVVGGAGSAPELYQSVVEHYEDSPGNRAFWLIFSGEYTKAMSKDWHSGHFCCWQCDESLTGQRYVLRDDHPYCVKCYESVFANGCEECNKIIGIDSKDLSYKDKHWHEACFLCNKCRVSLVDKQFGSKLDKIYCGNCYDAQFASRCDGCGQIFRAGTKKMEYKTRQWHEPCFCCCVCKTPIGTKSFIPREQEIYCAGCYEEKFATRCVKCNKIITSGGVTYKNEPWHRECFTCTNCNTSLAGQRFTSRDEKPYCAECFGELFAKRCTSCSKPITGIGGTRFISFEDRHWHNDCFICASCKTSLVGRGFITDADDIICPDCAKQKLL